MEVHHHLHQGKNKWREYFRKFLMLFLAVSLGFYAENIREDTIHEAQVKTICGPFV